ncbi:STAS domain-containing protein [Streptomyces sp. NPDC055239]
MPSDPLRRPVRVISEWTCLVLVLLEGSPDEEGDAELLGLALESAEGAGKRVIVDLSGVTYLSAMALNELLMPLRHGSMLPWLAGPLSRPWSACCR